MRNSLRLLFLTAIAAASALRTPPPIASAAAANYAISTVKGDDASIMKVTDFFVRGYSKKARPSASRISASWSARRSSRSRMTT